MNLAEAYLQLFADFFDVFLEYGFSQEDVVFCIHQEGNELEVTFSRKLWELIQEVAREREISEVTSLTTRNISKKRVVIVAGPREMAMIQHAIGISMQVHASRQQELIDNLKREKARRIIFAKEEIMTQARAITALLSIRDMFAFYRKGTYHLIVKLKHGKKCLEFRGATASEVIRELEKYMAG